MGFFMEFSTLLQDCKANKVQVKNEFGQFHLLFNNLLAVRAYKQDYGVLKYFTCFFSHFLSWDKKNVAISWLN